MPYYCLDLTPPPISYYKSLSFYLQEQPTLLTDLLTVLIPRIDHARVVRMFRQVDHIPLIRSYLIAVQHVSFMCICMINHLSTVPPF
jgi:hypothetical protein